MIGASCRTCGAPLSPGAQTRGWCTYVVYVCGGCGRTYTFTDVAMRQPSVRLRAYRLRRPPTEALWSLQRDGELLVVSDPDDGDVLMVVPLAG